MGLEAKKIYYRYSKRNDWIIKDFSLTINPNEIVGLVAPSGYGKSTIGKILAKLIVPENGEVLLDGEDINYGEYLPVQLIYQHPELSINPYWKMKKVLEEAGQTDSKLIQKLGIRDEFLNRLPNELSGGELQRFCVLRALRSETKYIIADEISTMLDVITQAQIWKIIVEYAEQHNIGILVITHDRNLSKKICTRIVRLDA